MIEDKLKEELIRQDMILYGGKDAKHCYLTDFEHLEPYTDENGNVQPICDYGAKCPFQKEHNKKDYCSFADQYNKMNYKIFSVRNPELDI